MMSGEIDKKSRRQQQFLRRLREAEERLDRCIEGLDEAVLCQEPVLEDWTIKDILGHIVSWNEEFRANIAVILGGGHPGYDRVISGEDNFDGWNQRWVVQKRKLSLDQVTADLARDYQEAAALIERLHPEDFRKRGATPWQAAAVEKPAQLTKENTDSVETLVTYHWRHMNEHIRQIEKWRQSRGKGKR